MVNKYSRSFISSYLTTINYQIRDLHASVVNVYALFGQVQHLKLDLNIPKVVFALQECQI